MLRTFIRRSFIVLALLMAFAPISGQAQTGRSARDVFPARVPRWEPADFTFTSAEAAANPFVVRFSADMTGPHGEHLTLPGFYDGKNAWKIRFSPPTPGAWTIQTHSDLPEIDNKQASLFCVPNPNANAHGGLRVDPRNPRQFVFEDGTHWLPMGYECDWLWALDTSAPALPTLGPFLDKITADGFNFILLDTYAYDTTWRAGKTGPDDYGPPPLCAWEGTNDNPDFSRFNLAYWQHFDKVMDALNRRGLVAHLLLKVYNKRVHWPPNGSAVDDLYYRWIIARYAAYPNVTWDLAKEANYEKSLAYKIDRLKFIRAADPYHRLLTVHDDHATYNSGAYNGLLDYRTDQQHTLQHETMRAHLAEYVWPIINAEFGYECGPLGPSDKTYSVAQGPEEVARRAWEISLAGGGVAYYYTYTAWDVIRPGDTPPGYAYFKHLHEFFAGTHYWRLEPADALVTDGYCLADPGEEYVVFQNAAAPFTLTLRGLTAPLSAEWFQPFSGKRQQAGMLKNGAAALTPPPDWGVGPVALHVWNSALSRRL